MKKLMSEEVRAMLLSKVPFNKKSTIDYTPSSYLTKGEDNKYLIPDGFRPIFKVRILSDDNKKKVLEAIKLEDKDESEKIHRECVRECIVSWEKFYDAGTMEEIDVKVDDDGGMSKDIYYSIPPSIMKEFFMFIIKISGLITVDRID